MENVKTIHVLNLGAGVQSTRLYLEAVQGIEYFDYAIFADTQEEPLSVYKHLDWLRSLNGPPILTASRGSLGEDLKWGRGGKGHASAIPAFTLAFDGKKGKTRRSCTADYKISVIKKVIREQIAGLKPRQRMPKTLKFTEAFGITSEEAGRSSRIRKNWNKPWSTPKFPLLDRDISRKDCIAWLASYGIPHEVPRSACVFCPYKSNYEWRLLRDTDPIGWQRALEIDNILRLPNMACNRRMQNTMYLHKSLQPLEEAPIDENPHEVGFAIECTGGCGL